MSYFKLAVCRVNISPGLLVERQKSVQFVMSPKNNKYGVLTSYLSAYEDGTECSETSKYKIQTPGNYPEESTHDVLYTVFIPYLLTPWSRVLLEKLTSELCS
jgi:hypothetical protein